jgi:hypothetical protein
MSTLNRPEAFGASVKAGNRLGELDRIDLSRRMRTLVISDLHLGNGGPYDVFEGAEALPSLLDRMSDAPLRVLVNGDAVDFLMNDDPLELDPARAAEQARASRSAAPRCPSSNGREEP